MDRLHLVQHRYSILVKMATRMKNSVEVYTVAPNVHEHAKGVPQETPEMQAMRKLLDKKSGEDMHIDYMETPMPKQHKLPNIPPDNVRLDNELMEKPEKPKAVDSKDSKASVKIAAAAPKRELRQDEKVAASNENLTLTGYASMESFPGQVSASTAAENAKPKEPWEEEEK